MFETQIEVDVMFSFVKQEQGRKKSMTKNLHSSQAFYCRYVEVVENSDMR